MLTKEQEPTEPWGETIESRGPVSRNLTTVVFVFAFILMCICEMIVIRGLWFKQRPTSYTLRLFEIPLLVLIPGVMGLVLRVVIKGQSKVGQISLGAASTLNNLLCVLLVSSYMTLSEFVNIAFP